MLIIEAKNGSFTYNSKTQEWLQGRYSHNDLTTQLTAKTHGLASKFSSQLAPVPVGYCLWFSTAQDVNKEWYPPFLSKHQIIDYMGAKEPSHYITQALDGLRKSLPDRKGGDLQLFNNLKKILLRGSAFFESLRTRFDLDEPKYLALTDSQISNYKSLLDNQRILTRGCAGSGKALIAQKLAIELAEKGEKVLLLCFNRMLANNIAENLKADGGIITVNTFHAFARNQIETTWWDAELSEFQKHNITGDFFEYAVGPKFLESLEPLQQTFDTLIIDEGQDMKQDWLSALYTLVKPTGRISIFMDEQQDIFKRFKGIPEENTFAKQRLTENCRNTKKINDYITQKTGISISSKEDVPDGIKVKEQTFTHTEELIQLVTQTLQELLQKGNLRPHEILILVDVKKAQEYQLEKIE